MPRLASLAVSSSDGKPPVGLNHKVFSQTFAGCDLIIGPNGAGKTTRGPLGITVALEGLAGVPTDPRRPYVGALPASTLLTLALDTGETVTRDLSVSRGKLVDAANQQARDLVGIPPTAWDLSDFTRGTDGDRGKILDLVARAGGSIEAWDRDTAIERVLGHMPESEQSPVSECALALPAAESGAAWLSAAEKWAVEKQSARNAAQKAAWAKTRDKAPPSVDGDPAADKARADALRAEKAKLQSVDVQAASRHDAEGARLAAATEAIKANGLRLRTPTAAVDPSYQRRVDEAKAATAPDLGPLEAAVNDAVAAEATALAAVTTARAERGAVSQNHAAAEAKVSTLAKLADPSAVCAHCGESDPLGILADLEAARAEVERLASDLTDADKALGPVVDAHAKAVQTLTTARAALDTARRTAPDPQALARAESDLARETARHAAAEAQREADLVTLRGQYQAAVAAHAAWSALPRPPDAEIDTTRIAAIDAELAEIDARTRAHIARETKLEQMRLDLAEAERADARWKATVALVAAIRQARDDMAAVAYRPIETAARELLADYPTLLRPYFAGPDDYGAEINGEAVPYHGLSEAQERITAACFVYALAVVSKNRVRIVLLDGIEVVTVDHRIPLLTALSAAVAAGKVDSVVLTMATGPDDDLAPYHAIPGLTVHVIDSATVAVPAASTTTVDGEMPF